MFKLAVESNIGDVVVKTTEHRGLTPEELAERAVEQIVSVSSSVDPIVRQQRIEDCLLKSSLKEQ